MENIKPYNKYKPSGIAWLGDIPEHWDILDTKRCFNFPKNNVGKDYVKFKVLSLSIHGVIFRNIENGMGKYHSDMGTYQIINPDSIILCLFDMDVTPRIIGYSDKTGIITSAYVNITPKENVSSKYFYYYYLLQDFNNYLFSQGTGIRTTLTRSQFGSLKISLPTFKEQTAIAYFLDYKTAKIDRFIRKKKQLIKLLNEQKAGIINHAVTKGLDPNATMKDSGIEWLGEIPKHWGVRKLKYVADFQSGEMITSETISNEGEFPVYGGGGFRGYTNCFTNNGFHVLIGRQGALCGNIKYAKGKFWASEHSIVTYPKIQIEIIFLGEILRLCNLGKLSQTAAQPGIAIGQIKNVSIPVPLVAEQKAIVSHIEKETAIITKTIATIEKEIALTQEYRTALITEAVTGKIDVRAFVIPTVSPQEELYEEIEDELEMVAEDAESYENE